MTNIYSPVWCADNKSVRSVFTERIVGGLIFGSFQNTFVMIDDEALNMKVFKIVTSLSKESGNMNVDYKIFLINDRLPIAAALPYGYIYISSGLLDILENEDELAATIAHALAHLNEKTLYETYVVGLEKGDLEAQKLKVSRYMLAFLFYGAIGVALEASKPDTGFILPTKVPLNKAMFNREGLKLFSPGGNWNTYAFFQEVYQGYENEKEMRADELAVGYLHKAGYNPHALVSVLEKFSKLRPYYEANGYYSHIWGSFSQVEERIQNAKRIIEKYR